MAQVHFLTLPRTKLLTTASVNTLSEAFGSGFSMKCQSNPTTAPRLLVATNGAQESRLMNKRRRIRDTKTQRAEIHICDET